jgi:hypothetical protein
LKVQECDTLKIAFVSRYGLYKFTVVSFGLTNAMAYFMYMMNKVFMEYLRLAGYYRRFIEGFSKIRSP